MNQLENFEEVKIKAAVVEKRGAECKIEDLVLKDLRYDEVLVKMVATGMCHTDMVAQNEEYGVPYPVVLGHEGAGIVERVGSMVQKVKPGDHVVLTSMMSVELVEVKLPPDNVKLPAELKVILESPPKNVPAP